MRGAFKSTNILLGIVLAAGLLLPLAHWGMAHAAGLGKINVLSRYGQPFLAEIDLINVTRDELGTLNASLAPTSAYVASNLRLDPVLNSLRLSVERRADGRPFVRASTTRRVYEPYVDLLVDLTWQGGKFQRHYAALMDLPSGSEAAASAAASSPPAPTSPLLPSRQQGSASSSTPPGPAAVASPAAPAAAVDRLPPLRALAAGKPTIQGAPPPSPSVTTPAKPVTMAAATEKEAQKAGTQTSPQTPAKPGETSAASAKPEAAPAVMPKADPAKPADASATAPLAAGTSATPSPLVQPEPPKGESKPAAPPETKAAEPASASAPPRPAKSAPAVTPPPEQRGLMATLKDYWLLVAGVLLALVAGLIGFLFLRRRDNTPAEDAMPVEREMPEQSASFSPAPTDTVAISAALPVNAAAIVAAPAQVTVANSSDVVDPLDEAKVYVAYGQYEEAEKVLRVALSKQRGREDVQLTLLQILAEQNDKEGFHKIAGDMHKRTGGRGENWKRAAAMGYALDPAHPLYPPSAEAAQAAEAARRAADSAEAEVVVFDLTTPEGQAEALASAQDIRLQGDTDSAALEEAKTMQLSLAGINPVTPAATAPVMDFAIEFPQEKLPPDAPAGETAATPATPQEHTPLDFKVDFPAIDLAPKSAPEPAAPMNTAVEFRVDVPDITPPTAPATPASQAASDLPVIDVAKDPLLKASSGQHKDDHWHDVQEKFDLVRAYQEMNDQDGVREVLAEIESEGDAGQQAEARKLLAELN